MFSFSKTLWWLDLYACVQAPTPTRPTWWRRVTVTTVLVATTVRLMASQLPRGSVEKVRTAFRSSWSFYGVDSWVSLCYKLSSSEPGLHPLEVHTGSTPACDNFFFFFNFQKSQQLIIVSSLFSSVNKNNSNTTFCSEFSAFLKPFSVNCDWRMLSVTNT